MRSTLAAVTRTDRSGLLAKSRTRWQLLYLCLVTAIIMSALPGWAYDDPFITYRYADNLSRGLGFVYNPGERILSTTTPLFTLLLSVFGRVWPDLPRLANLIGALSLAAGALVLWSLARTWQSPLVGWAALLLYPFFPLLLSTLSSEMPLYLALCLVAFVFYAKQHYWLTGIAAALALLTRPDGALVALVLAAGHGHALRGRAAESGLRPHIRWSAILVYLAVALPWYIFAWLYFGSPLPATLAAKQHQGSMAISQRFAPGLFALAEGYAGHWPDVALGGLALAGVIYTAVRTRRWSLVLLWTLLHVAAYSALGVSNYFWYYAPLVPGWLIAAGLGVEAVVEGFRRAFPALKMASPAVGVAGLFVLALAQGSRALELRRNPDERVAIYRAAGEWLRASTPPGATVGALEVGIIGYYARRPMVDFAGLIQPLVAEHLTWNTTYQDSARWAIETYRPTYLVLNPAWFPALMQELVLPDCTAWHTIPGADYDYSGELVIYKCEWRGTVARK